MLQAMLLAEGSEPAGATVSLAADGRVPRLLSEAAAQAAVLGHEVLLWSPVPGEEGTARASRCGRCGAQLHVRSHGGSVGIVGTALLRCCSPSATAA